MQEERTKEACFFSGTKIVIKEENKKGFFWEINLFYDSLFLSRQFNEIFAIIFIISLE